MENIVFTQLSISELRKVLREEIQEELQNFHKTTAQEDKAEYLSKKQIKERYNIAPATIDYNARMGYLERHYFGRLVRFKVADVEALFSNKSYVAEAAKQRILKRVS